MISCKAEDREITGEKLSGAMEKIDSDVEVLGERVEEFDKLETINFENITAGEILDLVSLNYQYTTTEEQSADANILKAEFVDGRKIMITRFNSLDGVESFFLQLQSNLYNQGYIFKGRLKYSDICNIFENSEQLNKVYLLKKYNFLILLVK
ncbi:MAG: hypothetical protein FJW66_01795 [Actinobacteria bacterium]|nr:hypothetical protein [Actinomycetota bacterium]